MIEYVENGDLFELDVDGICHGVNTRGIAGGLAYEVFRRFPENKESYQRLCSDGLLAGGTMMTHKELGQWVYNLATQIEPGPSARINLIEMAFTVMRAHAINNEVKSIGCPQIGAGIGGLQWSDVDRTIQKVWSQSQGVKLFVCTRGTVES